MSTEDIKKFGGKFRVNDQRKPFSFNEEMTLQSPVSSEHKYSDDEVVFKKKPELLFTFQLDRPKKFEFINSSLSKALPNGGKPLTSKTKRGSKPKHLYTAFKPSPEFLKFIGEIVSANKCSSIRNLNNLFNAPDLLKLTYNSRIFLHFANILATSVVKTKIIYHTLPLPNEYDQTDELHIEARSKFVAKFNQVFPTAHPNHILDNFEERPSFFRNVVYLIGILHMDKIPKVKEHYFYYKGVVLEMLKPSKVTISLESLQCVLMIIYTLYPLPPFYQHFSYLAGLAMHLYTSLGIATKLTQKLKPRKQLEYILTSSAFSLVNSMLSLNTITQPSIAPPPIKDLDILCFQLLELPSEINGKEITDTLDKPEVNADHLLFYLYCKFNHNKARDFHEIYLLKQYCTSDESEYLMKNRVFKKLETLEYRLDTALKLLDRCEAFFTGDKFDFDMLKTLIQIHYKYLMFLSTTFILYKHDIDGALTADHFETKIDKFTSAKDLTRGRTTCYAITKCLQVVDHCSELCIHASQFIIIIVMVHCNMFLNMNKHYASHPSSETDTACIEKVLKTNNESLQRYTLCPILSILTKYNIVMLKAFVDYMEKNPVKL